MQSMDELLPVDLIILGDLWHFLISEALAIAVLEKMLCMNMNLVQNFHLQTH